MAFMRKDGDQLLDEQVICRSGLMDDPDTSSSPSQDKVVDVLSRHVLFSGPTLESHAKRNESGISIGISSARLGLVMGVIDDAPTPDQNINSKCLLPSDIWHSIV